MAAREGGPGGQREERALGPRARRTRARLLDATAALLAERGLRDVAVVEIARRAETSPATFYQYFKDVSEATLALAEGATLGMTELVKTLPEDFSGPEGLGRARAFVRAFVDLWDAHHAVLRVRDHAAQEGDRRFRRIRRKALRPLLDRLAEVAAAGGAPGHPYAAAAGMATVLESLSGYHRELGIFGVDREALIETSARLLVETLAPPVRG